MITMATDGFMAGTSTTTAITGRTRNPGYEQQHDDDNSTDAWNKCKSDDEWRASHWETSSWRSSHWETSGWNDADECSDDRKGQLWSSHSFFFFRNNEHGPVDQLPLHGAMALPLSLVLVSHWLTLLHREESSIFVHFGRPKRLSSTSLDSNRVSSLATTKHWTLESKPRCWERLRCPPAWEASML